MAVVVALCLILSGCGLIKFESLGQNQSNSSSNHNWTKDGMIALSRPLPKIANADNLNGLGFVPTTKHNWLLINRQSGEVKLIQEDKPVYSAFGVGANKLSPGEYEVLHKQRNAPWYAPDAYYKARKLNVPPEGDKARYMRGALGEFVLYLDKSTPIHSGPIWNSEIGGVKVEENLLSKIYYSLNVGDIIKVE
ncbi:MAG: hypothetical protein KDD56_06540 [Bdellovibrionales bacterium]|nr:hypothetical protein [Bdellovibrionales bacterium]